MTKAATLKDVPRPALLLGLAGLIPFAAGALGVWTFPPAWADFALFAQTLYGAVIVSFMGAIHWGLALSEAARGGPGTVTWGRLGLGVLPPIFGWMAALAHPLPGLMILILTFAGVFFFDLQAVARGQAPAWYRPLRKLLTLLVILSLAVSLLRVATLPGLSESLTP